jgi:hypothetical protein
VKRDLEPGRPENAEETNVSEQVIAVGDGVVCGECCKIGYEEQVEEQFNAVGFVALREDERVVICTDQWRLDPWCAVVQPLQMLLRVAVGCQCKCRSLGAEWLRTHLAVKRQSRTQFLCTANATNLVTVKTETHCVA